MDFYLKWLVGFVLILNFAFLSIIKKILMAQHELRITSLNLEKNGKVAFLAIRSERLFAR